MLKKLLIAALAGLLIGAPARSQLLMMNVGQPTNGPFVSQLISQIDYTQGSPAAGDSLTQAGTPMYFNSSGVLTAASANTARFDCPNSTCLGWLVEASATNSFLKSKGQTAWSVGHATFTSNAIASPDGTTDAAFCKTDATSNPHYCLSTAVTSATSIGTFFVLAGGYGYAAISNTSSTYIYFNLTTCAKTSTLGSGWSASWSSGPYVVAGNSWCRIGGVATATNMAYLTLYPYNVAGTNGGNSPSFLGDGASGTYVIYGQVEAGAFPTSPIITTTIAVNRAADVAANADWWNGATGNYLMVEYISQATPGTVQRESICPTGCTATSFVAPVSMWIKRICQFNATPAGASEAIREAAQANGTACT